MALRTSNYEDFRKALKIDFLDAKGELIYETRDELKILMGTKGYHIKTDKETKQKYRDAPTQDQLIFAFNFLEQLSKAQRIIDDYIKETYFGRLTYRANTRLVINKKVYRKGQFIPKR